MSLTTTRQNVNGGRNGSLLRSGMGMMFQWQEKHPEWTNFYNKQVDFLTRLDAIDSKPNNGRVDISIFNQHYGQYGWQAVNTTYVYKEADNDVSICEQAEKLAEQKFGYRMPNWDKYL